MTINTKVIGLFFLLCFTSIWAEKAPQKVIDLSVELAKYGNDAVIIAAVKEQNKQKITLEKIKEMDTKWKATAGVAPYMQELIDSECGKHITKILETEEYFEEIFVMDNQGANVAMTFKTSDYWQGDEAKFKNSFKMGVGAVFVDDVEFDESTQTYLVQVSVPVKDGDRAIGAITFGINIDKIEE